MSRHNQFVYDLTLKEAASLPASQGAYDGSLAASTDKVTQSSENVNTKYSISDSDGNQLSKGQQEYFKASKMRDENGNPKVMYHGTENGGFHEFAGRYSDDGISFFFTDSPEIAESYSGSSEVYTAKTLNTQEDFRNFLKEIGETDYEVVGNEGEYQVLDVDGDTVAESETMRGLYIESIVSCPG